MLRIKNGQINGRQFIESLHYDNIIQEETGWSRDEVHQIYSILFRHHTFTPSEFEQNMDRVLNTKYATKLSKQVRSTIQEVLLQHDVSIIHYKIKNAQNVDEFSDCVINMVDQLCPSNVDSIAITDVNQLRTTEEVTAAEAEDNSNLIQIIFESIAECFIFG
eukprot:704004_1